MDFIAALQSVPIREMPWRIIGSNDEIDPYMVLVSEIMLQQTQVSRVVPKFELFIKQYPDVASLAAAPLSEVLQLWSGLGYNRRAKFLHQASQMLVNDYTCHLPRTMSELIKLPGVGKNTAGAILAYAFNQPVLYIETNIRTVYIHHFFHDQQDVPDSAILAKLEETLDSKRPREFYWSLMDYGSWLKKEHGNASRKSRTYSKQSKFIGSKRQLRGRVLRELAVSSKTAEQLSFIIDDFRLPEVLEVLQIEGLITKKKQQYRLG